MSSSIEVKKAAQSEWRNIVDPWEWPDARLERRRTVLEQAAGNSALGETSLPDVDLHLLREIRLELAERSREQAAVDLGFQALVDARLPEGANK